MIAIHGRDQLSLFDAARAKQVALGALERSRGPLLSQEGALPREMRAENADFEVHFC